MKTKTVQLFFLIMIMFLLAACSGEVNGMPEPHSSSNQDIETGRRLIASYGCGSCHSIPGVPGADAMAAPPLRKFYQRSYIAGRLPNTEENLSKWIQNPQLFDPGNAMPNLGVSEKDANAMVVYLYHQQTFSDWLRR